MGQSTFNTSIMSIVEDRRNSRETKQADSESKWKVFFECIKETLLSRSFDLVSS